MENKVEKTIDLNPTILLDKVDSWLDGAVALIPNIIIAVVLFTFFYVIAIIVKKITLSSLKRQGRTDLGEILGGFFKMLIIIMGALLALTSVVPSLNLGDLVASLGIGSVAIGFAFKDILQNWLAGLLILLRQPFEIGDQIVVNGFEGTVKHIETRATLIKTYDGEMVVIPNSEIYTNAVLVKTAHDIRRTQYDVGIGYDDDIDEACQIIKGVLGKIETIEQDPAPEAFAWSMAASSVTIKVRWWTDSKRADIVKNKAQAMCDIKKALDKAGIDIPYETHVNLVHNMDKS